VLWGGVVGVVVGGGFPSVRGTVVGGPPFGFLGGDVVGVGPGDLEGGAAIGTVVVGFGSTVPTSSVAGVATRSGGVVIGDSETGGVVTGTR
jgi:hypothetical protein